MFDAPRSELTAVADAEPSAGPDRAGERLRALAELAEIGMRIARRLADPAGDAAAPAPAEAALAFSRISRAVRQTLGLEARLEAEGRAQGEAAAARAAERRAGQARRAADETLRALIRKDAVQEAVEQAIEAGRAGGEDGPEGDGREVERLLGELDERLEDEDFEAGLADRPIGALVEAICRDLGVRFDPDLWRDEDWALEEARSREPGSPFALLARAHGWPAVPASARPAADGGGTAVGRPP